MMKSKILLLFMAFFLSTPYLHSQEQEEEVFMIVEDSPRFPGCDEIKSKEKRNACAQKKMLEFIYSNLKYPDLARMNNVQGQVVVQFVVNKEGLLENINLIRDIGAGCGDEVIKVIEKMNTMEKRWIPGKQRGRKVKVKYTLPVKFKLEGDAKQVQDKVEADIVVAHDDKEAQRPLFPGCAEKEAYKDKKQCADMKLLNYVYSTLNYPAEARINGIQGTAVIKFIVEKDGSLKDFEIQKDPGGGCGEAAKNTLMSMQDLSEKWYPAVKNGEKVAMEFIMPVKFKLSDF